jgi:hypothetical protein
MSLTPAQRSLRARIAANARVARPDYDGRKATEAATRARIERYYDQVDPTGTLPPHVREQKARAAWRADMDRARLRRSRERASSRAR